MNLCSGTRESSHDEVCFDTKNCPACAALDEAAEERASHKDSNEAFEKRIEELKEELDSIREPIIASLKTTQEFMEKGQADEKPIPKTDGQSL